MEEQSTVKREKYNEAIKALVSLSKQEQELLENAAILVISVQNSLEKGIKHYNKVGELLSTPEDVLRTLLDEGVVTLDTNYIIEDGN